MTPDLRNIFTVDVEDYFHPTEVQKNVPLDQWDSLPSRVEQTTRRFLRLLDRHHARGTFFILGWVAQKFPALVREIQKDGHEIGCHSHHHQLVYDLGPDAFRRDTMAAVDAIASAAGVTPRCYRAPSFSITAATPWALDILVQCGFTHDSSIYPVRHERYGIPGFSRLATTALTTPSGPIVEVPLATVELRPGADAPVAGGAYLRLLPYRYTAAGVRRLNREGAPACIYTHPWEIDPDQPRLARGFISRLRTYTGLGGMEAKLDRLLSDFSFDTLGSVFPAPPRS